MWRGLSGKGRRRGAVTFCAGSLVATLEKEEWCGGWSGFRCQNRYLDLILCPHSPLAKTDWKSQDPLMWSQQVSFLGHRAGCRRMCVEDVQLLTGWKFYLFTSQIPSSVWHCTRIIWWLLWADGLGSNPDSAKHSLWDKLLRLSVL